MINTNANANMFIFTQQNGKIRVEYAKAYPEYEKMEILIL